MVEWEGAVENVVTMRPIAKNEADGIIEAI